MDIFLPSYWAASVDPDRQLPYFFSIKTGESSWVPPPAQDLTEEQATCIISSFYRRRKARRAFRDAVQERFETGYDQSTGLTFYYDKVTQKSQWAQPRLLRMQIAQENSAQDILRRRRIVIRGIWRRFWDHLNKEYFFYNTDLNQISREVPALWDTEQTIICGRNAGLFANDPYPEETQGMGRSIAQRRVNAAIWREQHAVSAGSLDLSNLGAPRVSSRIWTLASLRVLILKGNKLRRLSSAIQDIVSLEEVDVSQNLLTTIPASLSKLPNLKVLKADSNQIKQWSPLLYSAPSLKELSLADNRIVSLPRKKGDVKALESTGKWNIGIELMASLRSLNLSNNPMTNFPSEICSLTSLEMLRIDCASGNLPPTAQEMSSLRVCAIRGARIDQNIESLFSLRQLIELDVSDNGMCPTSDRALKLPHLKKLNISKNSLEHWHLAPNSFPALEKLVACHNGLSFEDHASVSYQESHCSAEKTSTSEAKFCGCSSTLLSAVRMLELDLSHNRLRNLPPIITAMKELNHLVLSHNQLTACSVSLFRLEKITTLDLSDNHISSLPEAIANLRSLRSLKASHNKLQSLPDSIVQLCLLRELDVSFNQLECLPGEIGQLNNLERLDICNNRICSLPSSIRLLERLRTLRLHHNRLAPENYVTQQGPALGLPHLTFIDWSENCPEDDILDCGSAALDVGAMDLRKMNEVNEALEKTQALSEDLLKALENMTLSEGHVLFGLITLRKLRGQVQPAPTAAEIEKALIGLYKAVNADNQKAEILIGEFHARLGQHEQAHYALSSVKCPAVRDQLNAEYQAKIGSFSLAEQGFKRLLKSQEVSRSDPYSDVIETLRGKATRLRTCQAIDRAEDVRALIRETDGSWTTREQSALNEKYWQQLHDALTSTTDFKESLQKEQRRRRKYATKTMGRARMWLESEAMRHEDLKHLRA